MTEKIYTAESIFSVLQFHFDHQFGLEIFDSSHWFQCVLINVVALFSKIFLLMEYACSGSVFPWGNSKIMSADFDKW